MHPQSGVELLSVRLLIKVLPLCVFLFFSFFPRVTRFKKQSLESLWVGKWRKKRGRFDHRSKAKKKKKMKSTKSSSFFCDFLADVSKLLAVDAGRKMPQSVLLKWLSSTEWRLRHCEKRLMAALPPQRDPPSQTATGWMDARD